MWPNVPTSNFIQVVQSANASHHGYRYLHNIYTNIAFQLILHVINTLVNRLYYSINPFKKTNPLIKYLYRILYFQ